MRQYKGRWFLDGREMFKLFLIKVISSSGFTSYFPSATLLDSIFVVIHFLFVIFSFYFILKLYNIVWNDDARFFSVLLFHNECVFVFCIFFWVRNSFPFSIFCFLFKFFLLSFYFYFEWEMGDGKLMINLSYFTREIFFSAPVLLLLFVIFSLPRTFFAIWNNYTTFSLVNFFLLKFLIIFFYLLFCLFLNAIIGKE